MKQCSTVFSRLSLHRILNCLMLAAVQAATPATAIGHCTKLNQIGPVDGRHPRSLWQVPVAHSQPQPLTPPSRVVAEEGC